MFKLWIFLAIAAALFQALRTATQKHLVHHVDPILASGARFIFGAPFAFIALIILFLWHGFVIPNGLFWIYVITIVIVQIGASICTSFLLKRRNYAVGTILIKTEIVFIPVISFILLHEQLALWAVIALVISMIGTVVASLARIKLSLKNHTIDIDKWSLVLGCGAGFLFAVTTVCVRGATTEGFDTNITPPLRALVTVATVLSIQCIILSSWLIATKPDIFIMVKKNIKPCLFNGLMSVSASFCWFLAYTLISASLVKTVGQVEFLFMLCLSYFYFKERITMFEWLGSLLIIIATTIVLFI